MRGFVLRAGLLVSSLATAGALAAQSCDSLLGRQLSRLDAVVAQLESGPLTNPAATAVLDWHRGFAADARLPAIRDATSSTGGLLRTVAGEAQAPGEMGLTALPALLHSREARTALASASWPSAPSNTRLQAWLQGQVEGRDPGPLPASLVSMLAARRGALSAAAGNPAPAGTSAAAWRTFLSQNAFALLEGFGRLEETGGAARFPRTRAPARLDAAGRDRLAVGYYRYELRRRLRHELGLVRDALREARRRCMRMAERPAAPPPDPGDPPRPFSWYADARAHEIGAKVRVFCPANPDGARAAVSVYGTDVYTADSSVCLAGVHAGVIDLGGGPVTIVMQAGRDRYVASERHGVHSTAWGAYPKSFVVICSDC